MPVVARAPAPALMEIWLKYFRFFFYQSYWRTSTIIWLFKSLKFWYCCEQMRSQFWTSMMASFKIKYFATFCGKFDRSKIHLQEKPRLLFRRKIFLNAICKKNLNHDSKYEFCNFCFRKMRMSSLPTKNTCMLMSMCNICVYNLNIYI